MQTAVQTSPTVAVPKKIREKGFVVLGLDEYEALKSAAIPTYHLTGAAAEELDREVEQALKEDREGKTIEASSIREAMSVYDAQGGIKD
ncbi:MAG: hypothetical protein HYT31_04700 [Parcubacteria group bacterium]|nr:hypothetical protein [Parcubacteria group bacterium]